MNDPGRSTFCSMANNPISNIDPDGRSWLGVGMLLGNYLNEQVTGQVSDPSPTDYITSAGVGAILVGGALVTAPYLGLGLVEIGGFGIAEGNGFVAIGGGVLTGVDLAPGLHCPVKIQTSKKVTVQLAKSPAEATIPVYRGTADPNVPQVARSQRGLPSDQVINGGKQFLSDPEGAFHNKGGMMDAEGNIIYEGEKGMKLEPSHPDGVSVSKDPGTASRYGTHTIKYAVPKDVYSRLPEGDPTQFEKVFKGSIPEEYRVGVSENPKK
jgi:hypothetical protein